MYASFGDWPSAGRPCPVLFFVSIRTLESAAQCSNEAIPMRIAQSIKISPLTIDDSTSDLGAASQGLMMPSRSMSLRVPQTYAERIEPYVTLICFLSPGAVYVDTLRQTEKSQNISTSELSWSGENIQGFARNSLGDLSECSAIALRAHLNKNVCSRGFEAL